jgi:predicted metal-dependent phosphoesterase TrpH
VDISRRRGISVLALTDHDTLDGWKTFKKLCQDSSIRPVSGVELSSVYSVTVHILGYRIERLEILEEALSLARDHRNERNERIVSRLRELGLDVTMDDVKREAAGKVIARPHIARALAAKRYAVDLKDAFTKYLARGAAAYVEREGLSPSDCVRIVRESGGLPVLAHPSLTGYDLASLGGLLEDLKSHGLWGLECISSHCTSEEAYNYLSIAAKHSLYPTAGSDFHGSVRPNVVLGVQVSDDFLPWARLGISF